MGIGVMGTALLNNRYGILYIPAELATNYSGLIKFGFLSNALDF